jgi:large subunit ribosomal protein L15
MRFKKKKAKKQRASTYHGYGRGQAHHKGAGNRGGRGRAGSGKRADAKKPSFWKEPTGKRGFNSINKMRVRAINIEEINDNLAAWAEKGFAVKSPAGYQVDLTKTRFNKLLGTGEPNGKLFITTDFASKSAVAKIKAVGGEVKVLKVIVKKQKKKAEKPKKKIEEPEDSASSAEASE